MEAARRAPLVLGAADGLIIVLGLVAGMVISHQRPGALWHAALGAGLAELVGMGAALWLADDGDRASLPRALTCGAASAAGVIVPAIPYAIGHGTPALSAALVLIMVVAGIIAWLRPARGMAALAQTYGALALAAAVCAVGGLA